MHGYLSLLGARHADSVFRFCEVNDLPRTTKGTAGSKMPLIPSHSVLAVSRYLVSFVLLNYRLPAKYRTIHQN